MVLKATAMKHCSNTANHGSKGVAAVLKLVISVFSLLIIRT